MPTTVQDPEPSPPDVDVRLFGARGDDALDDTQAIVGAIGSLPSEGGVIFIPTGTYYLTARYTHPYRAIDLSGSRNIVLRGEGSEKTILRMSEGRYHSAISMISISSSSGITLRDLSIDGDRQNVQYEDEQSHGLSVASSSDILVARVGFSNFAGDGLRIIGAPAAGLPWSERIRVEDSDFRGNGRNGISIQRAVRNLEIRRNSFQEIEDQSISSEPTGQGGPSDIVVEDNVIHHSTAAWAIGMGGINRLDVLKRLVFRRNRIENGAAFFGQVQELTIEENHITGDALHHPLRLADVDDVSVVGNELIDQSSRDGGAMQIVNDGESLSANVLVEDNTIRLSPDLTGIHVRDAREGITIRGNRIVGAGGKNGIMIENVIATGTSRPGFTVKGNRIEDCEYGIRFMARADGFAAVEISNNQVDHDQLRPTRAVGIALIGFLRPDDVRVLANVFGPGITRVLCIISGDQSC
jgi:polygalacturonase